MVVLTDGPVAVVDRLDGIERAALVVRVREKTCSSTCGRTLPDTFENFPPHSRRPDGTQRSSPWCRECRKEYNRRNYAANQEHRRRTAAATYRRAMADPERAQRLRDADRERKRRLYAAAREDEELAARLREIAARYRARIMADPMRHAEYLEIRRMARRLLDERRGRSLDSQRSLHRRDVPHLEDMRRVLFDVEPLREWLRHKRGRYGLSIEAQADLCGVSPRRLRQIDKTYDRVTLDVADTILTRWPHEIVRVEDLYPELEGVELVRLAR